MSFSKKQITRILLLGIMLLMPLAEADANYYYKVRLVEADGTTPVKFDIKNDEGTVVIENSEWSDWIYNEAELEEFIENGEKKYRVKDWKNSLRKLVEGQKVKDQSGNDVYLYESTTTINWKEYAGDKFPDEIENARRRVVAIAFKGVHQEVELAELEDFGILDGDDYYYSQKEMVCELANRNLRVRSVSNSSLNNPILSKKDLIARRNSSFVL